MYISAQVTPNMKEVLVWERTKAGRVTKRYPAPYYFYVQDEDGEYSDIHDNKLRRLDFADYNSFKEKRDRYLNFGEKVYESDIAVDQKILSEYYYGKENTVDSHISFFDIEVDYDKEQGFSSPQNPYAPINAISLFHFWSQKSYMLLVSPHLSQWNPGPEWTVDMLSPETRAMADIQFFESEEELLLKFFELIQDTDIIVGWNSEGFDVPYVYERCLRLWGDRAKKLWCFDEAKEPRYKEVEGKFGQIDQVLEIFGREHVDYLKAFQKFEMSMRPSYTLDAISEEILPELKKLDYEGTLYSLYRNDFEHFVRYGIRDSECLDGFEKKLGYIRLAVQMTHGSTTHLKNVMGTLKVVENAIINFCHYEMNKIVPDSKKEVDMSMGKFTGAVVLKPRVGMHERVAALDVNSLYPSAIRTVNISPEKIVGQFFENHRAYEEIFAKSSAELYFRTEDGEVEIKTAAEWYDYFREQNFTLSGYGTVFNQDSQGFLPTILAMWYKLRKEYHSSDVPITTSKTAIC
jgi:DNA polymerase elongation subunit (family B)